ncbi:MAG: YopX family protein [Spirochaetes bacterium]|nr:YopX family protein [Spirochaetota bacterium]
MHNPKYKVWNKQKNEFQIIEDIITWNTPVNWKLFYELYPETGLKDVNRNPLFFDCDIIKLKYSPGSIKENHNKKEMIDLKGFFHFNIEDQRTDFYLINDSIGEVIYFEKEKIAEMKLIGTIHQNPELFGES